VRSELLEAGRPDQRLLGNLDVAEVAGDVQVLAHRAADDADLAAHLHRDVDRLLHAVDVGGEAGDEDAAAALRDDLPEGLADEPLRAGDARPFRVRRVRQQQIDPAVAELGERAHVGLEAVHGRVVELPVGGDQDPARGRFEHDGDRVRDRVRHADELGLERPDAGPLPGVGFLQLGRSQQTVLVELGLDQAERQPRRPHLRDPDLAQEVRQGADVVLVTVGQDDRANALGVVAQVAHVGQDQVDAEVLVPREREARVDDHDLASLLEDGHVLADLAEAAERDDP
jgi:hypothetical protein